MCLILIIQLIVNYACISAYFSFFQKKYAFVCHVSGSVNGDGFVL